MWAASLGRRMACIVGIVYIVGHECYQAMRRVRDSISDLKNVIFGGDKRVIDDMEKRC